MNHQYKVRKISDIEYHVVQFLHGLHEDDPYIMAKCTGPVPANDILIALHVQQELNNNMQMLEGLSRLNLVKAAKELENTLRLFHTIPVDEDLAGSD